MSKANYDDRLRDYVDVKERIALFYAAHPDGRLVTERVELWQDDDVPRIVVKALAYRTADDPHPGTGWSWMVLPGTTPYTRGSEIENAETSAWGRAIGSLGIGISASIASADEVASKSGEDKRSYEAATTTHADGLIGEAITQGNQDGELRTAPDGTQQLPFRIKAGRVSQIVVAKGDLAEALALIRDDWMGKRVTVWGTFSDESFPKGRETIVYKVLHLERIATADFVLPAREAAQEPTGATLAPEPVEAESEALPWDPAESARLDAEAVA